MNCPVCENIGALCENTRRAEGYNLINRKYKCPVCKIKFSTQERLVFTSLPKDIKENFLNTGKRGFTEIV